MEESVTTIQVRTLEMDIKERQVQYELPDGSKGSYPVLKVLGSAAKLWIPGTSNTVSLKILDGSAAKMRIPYTSTTVSNHFRDHYRKVLEWPNMPCLWLGSRDKAIYIPVEFCRITAKSLPFVHKLEEHIFNMIAQQGQGEVEVEVGANSKA